MSDDLRPLRVGVLGCGAVTHLYHAPALESLERRGEVVVRALFDPDPRAAEELRARLPEARVVAGVAGLMESGVELVIVASPPRFHCAQSVRLLRAGIPVLCEKPMARTVAEAEMMVEVAESTGGVLAVGMVRRFLPATRLIRSVLAQEILGPLRWVSCREGGAFRWPTRSASFFEQSGGGVLADVGVHVLDLLAWWFGPPEELQYRDDAMGGVEANCRIDLRFAGGGRGEVILSRDWDQPNRYLFWCEKGWLSWEVHEPGGVRMGLHEADHGLDASLRRMTEGSPGAGFGELAGTFEDAFVAQLCNTAAAIRGREPLAVAGRDALVGLRLLEQCYANRRLLPMPWLSEAEAEEAQRLSGPA